VIILDTNVVSEFTRPIPNAQVVKWMDRQPTILLYVAAVTEGELRYGVDNLPAGKRRDHLQTLVRRLLDVAFADRILPFDSSAAKVYSRILISRRLAGTPISLPDAQIAAIALSQSATLATRNTKDFQDIGLTLINPWEFSG
jgi:toxin FitB